MKTRTKIRSLYLLSAGFFAAGVILMVDRFAFPPHRVALKEVKPAQTSLNPGPATDTVTLADFEPLWMKRLQGEPRKPEPKQPAAVQKEQPTTQKQGKAPPEPKLPAMKLTGIFHSPKFPLALFEVNGKSVSGTVGETVNGTTIKEITPDNTTLLYRQKTFVLEIE